jgi:hypothetical protein
MSFQEIETSGFLFSKVQGTAWKITIPKESLIVWTVTKPKYTYVILRKRQMSKDMSNLKSDSKHNICHNEDNKTKFNPHPTPLHLVREISSLHRKWCSSLHTQEVLNLEVDHLQYMDPNYAKKVRV